MKYLSWQGFRKIVADRWEFANELFRKGAKHLLSEIHRRKSACSQPPPPQPLHHPHQLQLQPYLSLFSPPPQLAYHRFQQDSSPADSGEEFLAALSEDNRELRRRNSMLLSELAHMRKLYNDIIYFLQNHVEPVPPPTPALPLASFCRLVELGHADERGAGSPPQAKLRQRGDDDAAVKLFGVRLDEGKKRRVQQLVEEEEGEGDHGTDGSEV